MSWVCIVWNRHLILSITQEHKLPSARTRMDSKLESISEIVKERQREGKCRKITPVRVQLIRMEFVLPNIFSVVCALYDGVLMLVVLNSVTCLKAWACHFTFCFALLQTSIYVSILTLCTRGVVTGLLVFFDICHFTYTFSHANTEAHTHKHTCMISTCRSLVKRGGEKAIVQRPRTHTQKIRQQNRY